MPVIEPAIEIAHVVAWHRSIGSEVRFGQELCEVSVTEMKRLSRQTTARQVVGWRKKKTPEYFQRTNLTVHYRLVSVDNAFLRKVTDQPTVGVGKFLAAFSTTEDEPLPDNLDDIGTSFRVVIDPVVPSHVYGNA